MNAYKTVNMPPRRIPVRPMHDRFGTVAVVNHLAANLDAVAGMHRDARREPDVVDDLDRACDGACIERFVFALGLRAEKEMRRVEDAPGEGDLAAAIGVIGSGYRYHRRSSAGTFTRDRYADKGSLRCA